MRGRKPRASRRDDPPMIDDRIRACALATRNILQSTSRSSAMRHRGIISLDRNPAMYSPLQLAPHANEPPRCESLRKSRRFVSAFFGHLRSSLKRRVDLIYHFYCALVTERSEITGTNSARISSSSTISIVDRSISGFCR